MSRTVKLYTYIISHHFSSYTHETHASETGAISGLHFSVAHFWHVCHAYLASDSSGARFRRRTLFWSRPESGVHVTEMMVWSMIIA